MTTIRLPPDFKEFLRLLAETGVEHLIVGGYAVAFHGHPRATGDMDLWIRMSEANPRGAELTVNWPQKNNKSQKMICATKTHFIQKQKKTAAYALASNKKQK